MTDLYFMGEGPPEPFRCRIYGTRDDEERRRRQFIDRLAGDGVLDAPAYDEWVAALDARGWIYDTFEPFECQTGRVRRWRLNDKGRAEWARIKREG